MDEVKTVTLASVPGQPQVKLGMVSPKAPPKVVRLKHFLLGPVGKPAPDAVDYASKARKSLDRMYRNDAQGCCVISGKAHSLGVWSANDGAAVVTLTDAQIDQYYARLKAGPGDSGCIITDVLDYLASAGFQDDQGRTHKIDGYVAVDSPNRDEVKVAQYLFGALTIGFMVTDRMVRTAREGAVWTRQDFTGSSVVGGHDVSVVGYDAQGVKLSTWGVVLTMAWDLFTDSRCVTECYALLAPLWYGDDKVNAATTLDLNALKTAIDQLKGGQVPPIPDPLPPVPPTPPSPPPPPAPVPTGRFRISGTVTRKDLFGTHQESFSGWAEPEVKGAMGWPSLSDVQKLAEDVFALLASGEAATVEAAVISLIGQIKAGQYGAALATFVSTLPSLTVLVQKLTAIVEQFRSWWGPKAMGTASAGSAFSDWLKEFGKKVLEDLIESLFHLAA